MSQFSERNRSRIVAAAVETLESRKLLSVAVLTANTADAQVLDTGSVGGTTGTNVRVGDNGTNVSETNYVVPFQLPTLPAGATINSVTANFNLESILNGGSIIGTLDAYGLGRRASPTVLASDYYMGSYNGDTTDAAALQTAFATKTTAVGSVTPDSSGVAALTSYINAQYAAGAGAGQYVFLRLSPQAAQLTSRYWVFSTANNATVANRPTLTIDYTTAAPPAAPSSAKALPTSESTVKLDWTDNASNETGYTVQRSLNGSTWTTAGTVGANVTTFTDTGRATDTKHLYRVFATGVGGSSANSNTVTTATLPDFAADTVWVDRSYTGGGSTGSLAAPFTSISAAFNATTTGTGDGVVVRGGVYKDYVNMKPGVTLMGTPYERVVNSGFNAVTNWTAVSGSPGVFQTTLTSNPGALYVGYEKMEIAKSPNEGWWTGASVVNNGTTSHTLTDAAHLAGIPSLVGGQIMVHNSNSNTWPVKTITGHDTVNGTITFDFVGGTGLDPNEYYMVRGKTQLLDYDREWVSVDNGNGTWTVFFRPGPEDISKTQVRVGGALIKFDADPGASLRNFEMTGSSGTNPNDEGVLVINSNDVTIRDSVIHNNAGIGISVSNSDNFVARNNAVTNNGDSGISVGSGSDFAIVENNDIGFNAQDAVRVVNNSDDALIKNNYIHDSFGFTHPDGVQTFSKDGQTVDRVKITGNYIVRTGQAIIFEETANGEISNNVILHTSGYQILPGVVAQTVIKDNTFAGSGAGAVYPVTQPYVFTGNVVAIRHFISSTSTYVGDRNLFFSPNPSQSPVRIGTNQNHFTIETWRTATGQDANSQIGNPLFNYTFVASTSFSANNVALNTRSKIYVTTTYGFTVGDTIQINGDGVSRVITAIGTGTISFDNHPLPHVPTSPYGVIESFGTSTNLSPDLRLSAASPGKTMSSAGGPIGSLINNVQYVVGDFDGDGIRDVPLIPDDVLAGLDPTI